MLVKAAKALGNTAAGVPVRLNPYLPDIPTSAYSKLAGKHKQVDVGDFWAIYQISELRLTLIAQRPVHLCSTAQHRHRHQQK
jgi:hypothetical protein